jgi:hypothetical protein
MSITIPDLPESVIARYEAMAKARGLGVDVVLREWLIGNAPQAEGAAMSPAEWEKALDEAFDSFPAPGPLPDEALRRESIYGL